MGNQSMARDGISTLHSLGNLPGFETYACRVWNVGETVTF